MNKVVLTLTESSFLTDPFYIFVFENEFNIEEEPIISIFNDISTFKNRYNLFEITEDDNGSTTGGVNVDLSLISGQYNYKIYESPIDTDLTLDYVLTLTLVEVGRMVVSGCEENIEEIEDSIYS